MKSESLDIGPILFPYSYLTSDEKKRLSVVLPKLLVLRLFEPENEEKTAMESFVEYLFPVTEEKFLARLRKAIAEDQKLVYEHADGEALAIWEEIVADEALESAPFQLVTRIRGRFKKEDEKESRLWHNAYLLQLGIELEKQEIELLASFSDVKKLESEFKEVLGVEEDESLELPEGNYESTVRLWEYRDSSLQGRIKAWCFFCLMTGLKKLLPVVVSKSVRDKIEIQLEVMERETGCGAEVSEVMAELKDPAILSDESVLAIREEMSGFMDSFISQLSAGNPDRIKMTFNQLINEANVRINRASGKKNPGKLHVSLLRIGGISPVGLFKRFSGTAVTPDFKEGSYCHFLFVYPKF